MYTLFEKECQQEVAEKYIFFFAVFLVSYCTELCYINNHKFVFFKKYEHLVIL